MPDSSDEEESKPADEINNPGDVWDLGADSTHKTDPRAGTFLAPVADPTLQIGPLAMVIITLLVGLGILTPILLSKQSIFSSQERTPISAVDGGS
jgi:hypothetical protein